MRLPGNARSLPNAAPAGASDRVDLYVWDLPVRITHWTNVLSILILSLTGYYIANPFFGTSGVATNQYLMGTVRFIHFVVAFVFTVSVLFRIYWAFRGNEFARWRQFLPVGRARRRALLKMLGYYTFLRRDPPAMIGHNPLAGLTYIAIYVLFLLQIVTGFALYSMGLPASIWATLFGWMITAFGAQPVRLTHDIVMYLLIAFTIHHVYSAILIDVEERSGLLSSIVTGFKSLSRRQISRARAEENPPKRR